MFKKNRDLTEVFDDRWKANHNDDVKKAKQREIDFINKMFDVKTSQTLSPNSSQENLARLNKNIQDANNWNRQIQNKNRFK